jgi:hypothetical protein
VTGSHAPGPSRQVCGTATLLTKDVDWCVPARLAIPSAQGTTVDQLRPQSAEITLHHGRLKGSLEMHKWTYFGFLPAGNYLLSVDLRNASAVTDGWNSISGGIWLKVTNCPVTVNQGP